MGLKEFFRPTKLKLIIFFILVVFEIIMQFLSPESTWIVSRILHFIEGILIIPLTPFIIMFGLSISLVIVIIIYFYLLSSIVCYIRNRLKNKETTKKIEGPGFWAKFKELIRFKWLKVLLFFVFLAPLTALINPLVSGFFIIMSLILIGPIRALFPAFKMSGGAFFAVFSSIPLLLTLFVVYLVVCFIYRVHEKVNSKRVLYMILGIGVVLSLVILVPMSIMFIKFSTPYTITKDSHAPGCVEAKGYMGMGGLECRGKNIIKDIKVEPPIACLKINADNCDGGVLRITNYCEGLKIGDKRLPHEKTEVIDKAHEIRLVRDENGKTIVLDKNAMGYSEFSEPYRTSGIISAFGKAGDKEFGILIEDAKEFFFISNKDQANFSHLIKPPNCLKFEFLHYYSYNNSLKIQNKCEEEIFIGNVKIDKYVPRVMAPGGNTVIEFLKNESGNIVVTWAIPRSHSRNGYEPYVPLENETLSVQGSYNNKTFTVSYVKTKKLCD